MKSIITLVVVIFGLSACSAKLAPGSAEVTIDPVSIKSQSSGGFCPPGQAKKGRC